MSTMLDMESFQLFGDWLEQPVGLPLDAGVDSTSVFKDVTEVPGPARSHKQLPSEEAQDVLADLLTSNYVDPLGEDWMDSVDLGHFLDDGIVEGSSDVSLPHEPLANEEKPTPVAKNPPALAMLRSLLLQDTPIVSTPTSPEPQVCPDVNIALPEQILFEVKPEIPLMTIDSQSDLLHSHDDSGIAELSSYLSLNLPLSPEEFDVDSLLSGSGPSSPQNNLDSSYCDSGVSSPAGSCSESFDTDPEYIPQISKRSSRSRKASSSKAKVSSSPYSKPEPVSPHLDRKERKKQQNKNAAIRYRMKKKVEATGIKGEEEKLLDRNTELKGKVDELSREIKYMKDLMAEVYKARGLPVPKS